jgi:ubiquinol-cytochrome c reductase cytochrome b subunit
MSAAQEQPPSPGFWEQRTGWSLLKRVLLLEPLSGGSRWAAAFGSLLLFAFALQVVTGVLLAMNYAPSVQTAWPSVRFIQDEVPLGSFIRAVHHWGSGAMVVLLLLHLLQVFIWGAYKKPRELTWMVGVLLLFGTLALAFTGYLLPWDQKSYQAAKTGLDLIATTPLIGGDLSVLLRGGPELGNLTLTRLFALHAFVLPGSIVLLIVVHLYLFRMHGVTPPWWASPAQLKAQEEPFWPRQALKDGVLALVFLVGLGVWSACSPAPLGDKPASPAALDEPPRPEWYFMFYFRLLPYFKGPFHVVGTFVLPVLFFLILFFWPFLDRNPSRNPMRRPVAIGLLAAATAGLVGLTIFAVVTDVRTVAPPPEAPPQTAQRPAEPAGPLELAEVAKLYNRKCGDCHEVDGSGAKSRVKMPSFPNFTSLDWQKSHTDFDITHRILDGSGPLMPAYRDQLPLHEVHALAVYVRSFEITPDNRQPTPPSARLTTGELYAKHCQICHDADGSGRPMRGAFPRIPDFTRHVWYKARSDAQRRQSILEGLPGMPPMKGLLDEADAERLVAYTRAFHGQAWWRPAHKPAVETETPIIRTPIEPEVVPPSRETEDSAARKRVAIGLYRQHCLICHGVDGRGAGPEMKAALPTLPDFTNRTWQEGASTTQLKISILNGKGPQMPAFVWLNDEQANALTAYVRAFGPIRGPPPPTPTSDFEKRFRALEEQWDELERQLKEMSKPPPKP